MTGTVFFCSVKKQKRNSKDFSDFKLGTVLGCYLCNKSFLTRVPSMIRGK